MALKPVEVAFLDNIDDLFELIAICLAQLKELSYLEVLEDRLVIRKDISWSVSLRAMSSSSSKSLI